MAIWQYLEKKYLSLYYSKYAHIIRTEQSDRINLLCEVTYEGYKMVKGRKKGR